MTQERVPLFLNPTAGRGRAGRRLSRILDILERAGVAIDVHQSRAVRHLEDQVHAEVRAGAERVIVAGGDGSIYEGVNGIMRAATRAGLGVVPTGTGNDFAKACGIALDWEVATQALAERLADRESLRRIDVGRMNDRYFANGAGIGFDARVTRVARAYHLPIGDVVYLVAILRCLLDGIATPNLRIAAPGFDWEGPVTLANVANGPWIGGMFHVAPMADNSDGQFDLLIAGPVSRMRLLALLPKLIRGAHVGQPEIAHAGVRKLSIEAGAPVPSHLDGEVQPLESSFEIEILPGALQIL
jgi:diacylglycerol kinase (ATP)